jgi:hypothetical protein
MASVAQHDRVAAQQQARDDYYNEFKQAYMKKGEYLKNHRIEYFKKYQGDETRLKVNLVTGGLCGGCIGGTVGAITGGVLGTPGGPPGMAIGAGVGFTVGAAIGIAIAGGISYYQIHPRYERWCKTEAGKKFAETLLVFLSEEKQLQHLICPLTLLPVIEGVRTPDGQLFEKEALEAAVKKFGKNPVTGEALTLKQLKPDEGATLESVKEFIKLF